MAHRLSFVSVKYFGKSLTGSYFGVYPTMIHKFLHQCKRPYVRRGMSCGILRGGGGGADVEEDRGGGRGDVEEDGRGGRGDIGEEKVEEVV